MTDNNEKNPDIKSLREKYKQATGKTSMIKKTVSFITGEDSIVMWSDEYVNALENRQIRLEKEIKESRNDCYNKLLNARNNLL